MSEQSYARLLVELTREAADRCEETLGPPYWQQGTVGTYCLPCAKKKFGDDYDGGWLGEEDSPAHCESCGTPLDFTFTDEGVLDMLEHVEENGIHSDHDAYCVHRMLNAGGNPLLTERCGDWEYSPELAPRIKAVYERAVAERVRP